LKGPVAVANVTNLTATPDDTSVTLSWTAPADAAFSSVEISAPSLSTVTVAKGTNSKAISGLSNGTAYTFTVKTKDTAGNLSSGVSATATPFGTITPESFLGRTLTILSMSDEFKTQGVIAEFEKATGATVVLQVVPNEEYLLKLKARFQSGTDVPDIFLGEAGFIKEVVNLGMSEDLEKAPFNAVTTDQYEYAVQMGRDRSGVLRGLTWQTNPGAMLFRRSIAKTVWGTDDLTTLQAKFDTWEHYLSSGAELAAKGFYLLPGVTDLGNVFYSGKKVPYFDQNDKWTLDPSIKTYFETAKAVRDGGMDAKLSAWSAAWMAGMNTKPGEAKIFSYLWPTWGLYFVLNGQKNSLGDWAMIQCPAGWYWGGAWMNMYNKSPNKDMAWTFIKQHTQNKASMETYALRSGDFISNRTVVAGIKGVFKNEVLGGQNHYELFDKAASAIDAAGVSDADTVVNALVANVLADYLAGNIATVDLAMAEVTKKVKQQYPNATYP